MTKTFSPGKLFLFILSNIFGGLLQVWLLYLILKYTGRSHDLNVLLGDGGLFFFAMSLAVNSILVLFSQLPTKPSSADAISTFLIVFFGIGPSITLYAVVLVNKIGTASPFQDQIGTQFWCASLALAYSFFVGARTGYFRS